MTLCLWGSCVQSNSHELTLDDHFRYWRKMLRISQNTFEPKNVFPCQPVSLAGSFCMKIQEERLAAEEAAREAEEARREAELLAAKREEAG